MKQLAPDEIELLLKKIKFETTAAWHRDNAHNKIYSIVYRTTNMTLIATYALLIIIPLLILTKMV